MFTVKTGWDAWPQLGQALQLWGMVERYVTAVIQVRLTMRV